MADRLQLAPLSLVRQCSVGVNDVRADGADEHRITGNPLQEVHRWVEWHRFGGHFLAVCSCGCPGPFVLSVEEASRIRCGVQMAWDEGIGRLALVQTANGSHA